MQADPSRIRYVTDNYEELRGLRIVPLGVAIAAGGLVYALDPTAPGATKFALSLAFWVCIGLAWLAGRYYGRTFGQVQSSDDSPRWGKLTNWVSLGIPGGVVGLVALMTGIPSYAVFDMTVLAIAAGYPIHLQRRGKLTLRSYWAVACAIIAAWSLLLLLPLPAFPSLHRAESSGTISPLGPAGRLGHDRVWLAGSPPAPALPAISIPTE